MSNGLWTALLCILGLFWSWEQKKIINQNREILTCITKSWKEKGSYSFFPLCFPICVNFLNFPISLGLESYHKYHYNHNLVSQRKWSCFPWTIGRKHKWKTSSDPVLIWTQARGQRVGDYNQHLPTKLYG